MQTTYSAIPLAAICCAAGIALLACGASAEPLCVDHHPAKRSDHVTYGGLPKRPGFARDHVVSRCLGGPDTADNIQYQPWPEAREKDAREWKACEDYCAGPQTTERLEQARKQFR